MVHLWSSYLILFAIVLSGTYVYSLTINMPESVEGEIGNNLLNLTCSYTIPHFSDILSIAFSKENTTSGSKINLFYMSPDQDPIFLNGDYLINRTIIKGFTQASPAPTLTFKTLECSDDGIYYCSINYYNPPPTVTTLENSTHLVIKVPPTTPNSITYYKNDVQKTVTTMMPNNETGTNGHELSSPSSIIQDYGNSIIDDNKTFSEGDTLTLFCEGSTGKPKSNLTIKKVLSNNEQNIPITEGCTQWDSEFCSFYQNVTAIISLSAQDNQAIFRCTVGDFIKDTNPIDVKYPVRKPAVTNVTNGEQGDISSSITLVCSSNGNPAPVYSWYRAENTSHPNHWEYRGNTRNITFNITEEGIYRCEVNNTFAGKTYNENSTFNHTFTAITKQTTPIMSTSGGPEKSKIENTSKIYYVIGGVGGGALIIIIIVVAIVKCRGNRTKAPTRQQKKSSLCDGSDGSLVHLPSKRQTMDANNYCSVSPDDDGVGRGSNAEKGVSTQEETRKHNEKYLKEQNEKNSRNEDRGGHQPVEYAMVNKSFKGRSNNHQNDQLQPTEYAQVNKVRKTTPNEPPKAEDHYASGQGIYDHANDRRHKQTTESDQYDIPYNIKRKRSDKVGSVVEITGEPIKQKQVAKVKPSGRFGYENASMIPDDVIKKKEELNTEL